MSKKENDKKKLYELCLKIISILKKQKTIDYNDYELNPKSWTVYK